MKHLVKGKRKAIQVAQCLRCGTMLLVPAPYDAARRLRNRDCKYNLKGKK